MAQPQFRTWYGGVMHRWGIFPTKTGWEFIPPIDLQAPQLQNTGLLDKNGKEIYEGDIFPCIYNFDGCKKHKLEVVYDDSMTAFRLKNHGKCHQPSVTKNVSDMKRGKVLGNCFENPELIKQNAPPKNRTSRRTFSPSND